MKKYFYPFLICSLIPFLSIAQNDTTIAWTKVMGGSYDTHNSDIKPTGDGGYIVAGATSANDGDVSGNHGGTDAWVVKLDATGNIIWQKCLGGSANDAARSIQQTADGGYILAGTTTSNDDDVSGNHSTNGNADVWIVKLNATGTVQWQKCFGGSNNDLGQCIQVTTDSGYIFTAGTNSTDGDVGPTHADTCYWCVKLNSSGAIQWQKTFNGAAFSSNYYSFATEDIPIEGFFYGYYFGSYIQNTADKGFVISAESDHTVADNHGLIDYLVLKLDSIGNTQWQKSFGDSFNNFATCIKPIGTNRGYVVLGSSRVTNGSTHGTPEYFQVPWIIRLDNEGNIEWQKKDSLNLEFQQQKPPGLAITTNSIYMQANGDYFICGFATGQIGFGEGIFGWLAKLDSTGIVKGITYPEGLLYEFSQTSDGGLIAAGDIYGYRSLQDSTYVARTYVVKFKQSVLPILLLNFTATPQKNTVLTQWQTATEENSNYYNVQRSTDAVHFATVGKIAATGNSATQQSYTYTDNVAALLNTYTAFYYRLQEADKNGNETISKIVKVVFPTQNIAISASPNPVKGLLNVRINNYSGNATLGVFDMAGHKLQQITQYTNSANAITINTASLAAGTYIISTVVNGVKLEQKFVKQ